MKTANTPQKSAAGIDAAKARIVSMLKDPDSAKFKDVAVSVSSGAVCGRVNAKNSHGGYVGFRRFIVSPEVIKLEGDESVPMDYRWDELCSDI